MAPGIQSGANLDTGGILKLCDGDDLRKKGNSLIARQVELENMKERQF